MSHGNNWDWQIGKKVVADLPKVRETIPTIDELETEETGEKNVLRVKMKEKMKSADKKALEDALRILDQSSGGDKGK